MPRELRNALLRAAAGVAIGTAVWLALIEPYTAVLAGGAEEMFRLFEHPGVTRLHADGRQIVIDRTDFSHRSAARPALATAAITANVILLTMLFAANRRPLSTANVTRFLLACGVLLVFHVIAVASNVESIYARELGPWSEARYGPFARNFWAALAHFFTLVGSSAIAVAAWAGLNLDAVSSDPRRSRPAAGRRRR